MERFIDHDEPYTFGRPLDTYIGNAHHRAALLLLRSRLGTLDARAARPFIRRELAGRTVETLISRAAIHSL